MEYQLRQDQDPLTYLEETLLPSLHPETVDGDYLDRLSAEQLVDFTYRTGVRTDEVGDGNCLVPRAVGGFDDARFENPPAHRVSVLVEEESLEETIAVGFEGFVGSYLEVGNPYQFDGVDLPAIEIGDESYGLYSVERPFKTTAPPLAFRSFDSDVMVTRGSSYTEEITIEGREEPAACVDQRGNEISSRTLSRSGEPQGTLDQVNQNSEEISYVRPEIELEFSVEVSDDLGSLGTPEHADDFVRVTITVRNQTDVNEDNQDEWAERRVFFPSLYLDFGEAVVDFPTQQHDVKLNVAMSTEEESDESEAQLYRQQDCVLTRYVGEYQDRLRIRDVPIQGPVFRTTSFGVYDYVEEEPVSSQYDLDQLVEMSDEELVGAMTQLDGMHDQLLEHESILRNIRAVLLTLRHYLDEEAPRLGSEEHESRSRADEPSLHKFQWDSLQKRAKHLIRGETNPLVVQAPTSAGKTVVYYGSTLLSVFERDTRAVFPFPTRMLTEDKLEEVIDLAYAYNEYAKETFYLNSGYQGPDSEFSVGVAIGQQESAHPDSDYLHAVDMIDYIGECHNCGGDLTTECQDVNHMGACRDGNHLHYVKCNNSDCGFTYDFVYDVQRTPQYLPSLTVGTPEKFFRMPTMYPFTTHSTFSTLPFFGAPYKTCETCGRAITDMNVFRAVNNRDGLTCLICHQEDSVSTPLNPVEWTIKEPYSDDAEHSPVGHIVLDETHMYTGQFGIAISVIIRFFEVLASRLESGENRVRDDHSISADSGTATISNKLEHISSLLRVSRDEISAVPDSGEHGEYFDVHRDRVRYRILGTTPVSTSNRGSFREAVARSYDNFHNDVTDEFRGPLSDRINSTNSGADISDYEFILGYLHRRADGYALQESVADRVEQISDGGLDDLQFISGDSSKSHMRDHMGMGASNPDPVVLANLVVSLGIDIPVLNNLLLYGAPRTMSEQMQTIGRTGRNDAAGHAAIHLYPGKPRDIQIQRKFHQILGNIDDYFETAAIQPTNPHIADLLFHSVLSPFLTLEFAIREECVNPGETHILQDLEQMFDQSESSIENVHTIALFRDLQSIFCPEGLEVDDILTTVIENQVRDRLFEYVGDEQHNSIWFNEARRNRSEGETTNINSWFLDTDDEGLELRGQSGTRINTEIRWELPSEVDY